MTFISLIALFIVWKLDLSYNRLFTIAAVTPVFLLGFSFDMLAIGNMEFLMVHERYEVSAYLIILVLFIIFSMLSAVFYSNYVFKFNTRIRRYNVKNLNIGNRMLYSKYLRLYFRIVSLSVLVIFVISFSRLEFNIDLLLSGTREYELAFGKYTSLNYIFFLNVLAVIMFFLSQDSNRTTTLDVLLLISIYVTSLFFGNKSTFIDVFLVSIFFYWYRSGSIYKLIFPILVLFIVLSTFFEVVRGGGFQGIYEYLIQGYANFFYRMQLDEMVYLPIFKYLSAPLDLLFNLMLQVEYDVFSLRIDKGFVLNDKYNTYTSFYESFGAFNYLGFFIFFVYTYTVIFIFSYRRDMLLAISLIFASLLLLSFFTYRFSFFKYQYLIVMALFIHVSISSIVRSKLRNIKKV